MLKIGVVSQKGGVGKSTICRDLARVFALAQWKVKIADLDYKQTTSADWSRRRMTAGIEPYVAVEQFPSLKPALALTGVHLLIIDGKPHSSEETREIGLACDLVVIPTGTTLDDLEPQVRLAHELKRAKVPVERIVFVLNAPAGGKDAVERAAAYIEAAGYEAIETPIPRRDAYATAQNEGRSISEVTFPSLRTAAEQVAHDIMVRLQKVDTDARSAA